MRPYVITSKTGTQSLVQANSQSQALRHAALSQFTVRTATANEVIELMSKGVKPEVASQETVESDPSC